MMIISNCNYVSTCVAQALRLDKNTKTKLFQQYLKYDKNEKIKINIKNLPMSRAL